MTERASLVRQGASAKFGFRVKVAVGLVGLVLGYIGFGRYEVTAGMTWPDRLYQTVQLYFLSFDAYRPGPPVPVSLEIARWLAPVSTAVVLLGLASSVLQRWFDRATSRLRRNRVVIVAPAGRASLYDLDDGRPVVHVDDNTDRVVRGWHHIPLSLDARWIALTGAATARQIVIATGDDAKNLALLGEVLDALRPRGSSRLPGLRSRLRRRIGLESTPEVVVECSDWADARWLTLALTRDHADVDTRVLCPDEMIVHRVVRDLRAWLEDAADQEGRPPSVAVIGEAPLLRLLPLELVPVLQDLAGDQRAQLLLVSAEAQTTVEQTGLAKLYRIDVRAVTTVDELDAVSVAIVAHQDDGDSTRVAVRIGASAKAKTLFAPAVRPGPLPLSMYALEHREPSADEVVDGPLTTAARELWSDWPRVPAEQRRRLANLRTVLHQLMEIQPGSIRPRSGAEATRNLLSKAVADRLGVTMKEYGHLPRALRHAGFTYDPPTDGEIVASAPTTAKEP